MRHQIINTSAAAALNAWTDPAELECWLAEAAAMKGEDVVLTSCIPNISGRHRLLQRNDHQLTFDWYIDGCQTSLDVSFEPAGESTKVTIDQRCPDPLPKGVRFPVGKHYGRLSWVFALYQLKFYLEDGQRAMRLPWPDDPHTIRHAIEIKTPTQRVWQVLSDQDQLRHMSLTMECPLIDARLGGRYSFGWTTEEENQTDGPGHITRWEPEKQLSHTWHGGRDSEIHWQLKPMGDSKTHLSFQHTGLAFPYAEVWSYKLGWAEHLIEMKHYLERGTPLAKTP